MLTLKGHQHVRVNTRFVKLVVPSRHRVPKLSLLFPSSPPPRELPDQTRHTPDVVSLQAFRNSRIYPRHCYSILFSGFHTHRRIDELVVHELQSITMHPAPCLNHEWLQPRPILTSFARLCISTCSSGYRARMMRPRHVTRRRTGHSHVNDKFRTIREQFDVTSLAMTSFAVQSRLGRNNSNFFQCIQRVCKQISNRIVPLDD